MFIYVVYKDIPELSLSSRRLSNELDPAQEKILLVNPNCPVRIMLEYIRKQCKLGLFTVFDLCDASGYLKGLFNLDTYAYATEQFEHKRSYYVIVLKTASDKRMSVIPQLNQENKLYADLKQRVMAFLLGNDSSSHSKASQSAAAIKISPSAPTSKPPAKKK